MSLTRPDPLVLSRGVLRALTKLNWVAGAFIAALLLASLVAGVPVMRALGVPPSLLNPLLLLAAV